MLSIGSHPIWHPLFESLAYATGYIVFRRARSQQGDVLAEPERWTILAAAAVGALFGSRILGVAEQYPTLMASARAGRLLQLLVSPGGKTIVGGLLGGWLAVEIVKRLTGIQRRTGDLFALPLCVGIAIGRVGCFIAGLDDDTFGKPTNLPWAVNFGDGIGRHPTQIYEILFLAALAFILSTYLDLREGTRFRIFLAAYLSWRFLIDFIKPQPRLAGMNLIQWACLAGIGFLAMDTVLTSGTPREPVQAN